MEKVIVAFENEKSCYRIKDILETSNTALCLICRSASEVKRAAKKQRSTIIICGFKFSDGSAEELYNDLSPACAMLLVAVQNLLDLCGNEDIFRLSAPVSRSDLIASVRMLLQMEHRLEKYIRPDRSSEEQALIEKAKSILITRNSMTEEQAHRLLQKRSMDSGARLVQTAQMVLDGIWRIE